MNNTRHREKVFARKVTKDSYSEYTENVSLTKRQRIRKMGNRSEDALGEKVIPIKMHSLNSNQ